MALISVSQIFGLSPKTLAFPVIYTITGHLTDVDEGPPFLSVDDQFSGSFTIDSTTSRSPVPDYATWAQYDSKSTVKLTIGSRTWSRNSDSVDRCTFIVQNGERDEIDFFCGAEGPTRLSWWWRFVNSEGNAFVDGEIPLGPFAADAFKTGFAFFNFIADEPFGTVRGIPDSLSVRYASEPESIWIMLIGIPYLISARRTYFCKHQNLNPVTSGMTCQKLSRKFF